MAIGSFSDYRVHLWLAQFQHGFYLALHYDDPSRAGAYASEVFGGAYVRCAVDFSAPTGRVTWNVKVASFAGLPNTTVTHLGLWDAAVNGNFEAPLPLPRPVLVLPGGRLDFGIEQIALSAD